jgi:hypothetical protein
MGKRERERERKGWRGLLYPLTQKRAIIALRPGVSGKSPELREVRRLRGKTWTLRPPKVNTQKVSPVNVLVQRCLS